MSYSSYFLNKQTNKNNYSQSQCLENIIGTMFRKYSWYKGKPKHKTTKYDEQ